MAALAAEPTHSDALTDVPANDTRPDGIDHARDLMAGRAWIHQAGKTSVLGFRIAVADAARLDMNSHLACVGFRHIALDQLERTSRKFNFDRTHAQILR